MKPKKPVSKKLLTCPDCKQKTNGNAHKTKTGKPCMTVMGRRGWRQLGEYDG